MPILYNLVTCVRLCVYLNSWSWTCGCVDGLDLCVGVYSSRPWSVSSGICIDGPVLVAGVSALNVFPEPHLPSGSAETYVTTQVRKNSALTSNHDDNSNGIE